MDKKYLVRLPTLQYWEFEVHARSKKEVLEQWKNQDYSNWNQIGSTSGYCDKKPLIQELKEEEET